MGSFQKGEVYEVKPEPITVGKEIQKKRRWVIVSSNIVNTIAGLVTVCPLTEGIGKEEDIIHIAVSKGEGGSTKDCIVQCEQIKTVDEGRIMDKMGNLKAETMQKIDKGLRKVLGL